MENMGTILPIIDIIIGIIILFGVTIFESEKRFNKGKAFGILLFIVLILNAITQL